ncbi:MAG: hypothetical protein V3U20_02500 [Thermoplasmata archaeon]
MEYTKMITRWNGFLPVVEEMPIYESLWDKIESFMEIIRNIGATGKARKESIED